jgi:hypothetical protein
LFDMHATLAVLWPEAIIPDDDAADRNQRMHCPGCDTPGKTASVNYGKGDHGLYRCFARDCGLQGNPVQLIKLALSKSTAEAYDWIREHDAGKQFQGEGIWYKGHAYRDPGTLKRDQDGNLITPWH